MRYARLTATLALIALITGIVVAANHATPSKSVELSAAKQSHGDPLAGWKPLADGIAKAARERAAAEAAAAAAAAAEAQRQQELAARQAQAQKVARTRQAPRQQQVVHGADNGDFMSCVRNKESTNNYAMHSSKYSGAYSMSDEHWGGRGGYQRAGDAPPEMQDQKFREDMAGGTGYMHQQYPQTSRACGMR